MWENPISNRAKYEIMERMESIRNRYYGGLLDWDDALRLLKNLCSEFCGDKRLVDPDLRKLSVTAMAIAYMEPQV